MSAQHAASSCQRQPASLGQGLASLQRRRLLLIGSLSALPVLQQLPCYASIPTELERGGANRARAAAQLGALYAPPTQPWQRPAATTGERIQKAVELLETARQQSEEGQYNQALFSYEELLRRFSDFAFTELARIERALVLYQLGRVSESLLQLEDVEVALRGNGAVHAALAAVLYTERPAQRLLAEQQWEIAMEFDRRYADVGWVEAQKHWPPRALAALQRFVELA